MADAVIDVVGPDELPVIVEPVKRRRVSLPPARLMPPLIVPLLVKSRAPVMTFFWF